MKIISTLPGDANFHLFKDLPKYLYAEEFLALKNTESIPEMHLSTCFVLLVDDIAKARLSIYLNPDLTFEGTSTACFGNYECVDNQYVSNAILKHGLEEAKKLDAQYVIGPMNGSTWENYRFSLHHDTANFFLEPYYHLYYNQQFLAAGFSSMGNYHSLLDKEVEFKIPGAPEKQKFYEDQGVTFRNIDLDNFESDLSAIYDLNQNAFKTNFLYTPIDKEDFINKYKTAKQFIQPDFMVLAFDENKELIAYYFCVQDFYNKTEKSLIIKSIARNPDSKWRGLGQAIGNQIYDRAKHQGFTSVIHAFMFDKGTSSPLSEQFSENKYKKYRLYGQAI